MVRSLTFSVICIAMGALVLQGCGVAALGEATTAGTLEAASADAAASVEMAPAYESSAARLTATAEAASTVEEVAAGASPEPETLAGRPQPVSASSFGEALASRSSTPVLIRCRESQWAVSFGPPVLVRRSK